jgi:hypothetical protein
MRGVLYSGILIMVVFVMLSIMAVERAGTFEQRQSASMGQEIKDVDSSYRSIERSLHTLSDVSLRRAIIASQNSILNGDSYFEGGKIAPDVLKQLMWNGTLQNQTWVDFMNNNSLEDNIGPLADYYSSDPRNYNVSITLDYSNSTVGQFDAFSIFFNTTAQVNISKAGVANLSRRINVFEKVSVVGFEDSFYLINVTGGKESRVINRSSYMGNFTQRVSLDVIGGDGNCYGTITSDPSALSKDKKIFYNSTIYPGPAMDFFCSVIFVSGASPNTSYLKVSSVSDLSSFEGSSLLLLGNGEIWGINKGLFNVSNFIAHMHEGGYTNSSKAPSFFDILEGNTYCTYCSLYGPVGLETLIDKNRLSAPEMHIEVLAENSNAIYEYLNETEGSKLGMNESSVDPSFYEFRLSDSMKDYFN